MHEKRITEYEFFKKLCKLPFIEGVYLYGSRARKEQKERSDIDLAINCPAATNDDWLLILDIFEETDTLLKIDCVRLDELSDEDLLKQNILKEKVVLYEKSKMTASVIEHNFKALGNALDRLKEALDETPDEKRFIIDSTIHRFEFCFELFWKNFKNLAEQQGKEALSPRQAISAAYMLKWFDDEKIWLNMLKDRNLMPHTYKEINADIIYKNIITYYPEMKKIYDSLKFKFNL